MNEMQKTYKTNLDIPEFDAFELNELYKRRKINAYYVKAYDFVLQYLDGKVKLTDKTIAWLWGLKKDLRMGIEDDSYPTKADEEAEEYRDLMGNVYND